MGQPQDRQPDSFLDRRGDGALSGRPGYRHHGADGPVDLAEPLPHSRKIPDRPQLRRDRLLRAPDPRGPGPVEADASGLAGSGRRAQWTRPVKRLHRGPQRRRPRHPQQLGRVIPAGELLERSLGHVRPRPACRCQGHPPRRQGRAGARLDGHAPRQIEHGPQRHRQFRRGRDRHNRRPGQRSRQQRQQQDSLSERELLHRPRRLCLPCGNPACGKQRGLAAADDPIRGRLQRATRRLQVQHRREQVGRPLQASGHPRAQVERAFRTLRSRLQQLKRRSTHADREPAELRIPGRR